MSESGLSRSQGRVQLRPRYEETDQGGIIHHSRYVVPFKNIWPFYEAWSHHQRPYSRFDKTFSRYWMASLHHGNPIMVIAARDC